MYFFENLSNEKCASKAIFFDEKKKNRKIRKISEIGNWLLKSEFCKLLSPEDKK